MMGEAIRIIAPYALGVLTGWLIWDAIKDRPSPGRAVIAVVAVCLIAVVLATGRLLLR